MRVLNWDPKPAVGGDTAAWWCRVVVWLRLLLTNWGDGREGFRWFTQSSQYCISDPFRTLLLVVGSLATAVIVDVDKDRREKLA